MRFTKSDIIPSEFTDLEFYDLGGNMPGDRPFNITAATKAIEVKPADNFRNLGTCCICGTHFRYGEVWVHEPSDTRICVGHVCASRYGLMASNPEYDRMHARHIRQVERSKARMKVRSEIKTFMADKHDLFTHLKADHYLLRDLRAKLIRWGNLSEKQVALAAKIAGELEQRAAVEAEKNYVPVPETDKRIQVEGTLLGIKWVMGFDGHEVAKMIVEVQADGGVYKLFGTCPESIQLVLIDMREQVGGGDAGIREVANQLHPRVRFTCRIERSFRDEHFGFFKRPTKAEVIS